MSEHPTFAERAGTNINTWISIGVGVVSLLSLAVVCGMYFGSIKQIPEQITQLGQEVKNVGAQVAGIERKQLTSDMTLANMQGQISALNGTLDSKTQDDARQWDHIRNAEAKAERAVAREDFIEWKSRLEKQNPSVSSPPLQNTQ